MTSAHELANRLPRVEETHANAGARLLATLARAGLRARVAMHDVRDTPDLPDHAPWRIALRSDFGPLAFEPVHGGGMPRAIASYDGAPDLASAGEALEASEPLIAAIERALGTPLWPQCLTRRDDPPGADRVIDVHVETSGEDCARLSASSAVLERLPSPRWDAPPPALLELDVPCRIRIGGCTLGAERLAALGTGDLLIDVTRTGPSWAVQVATIDGPRLDATLDAATHELTLHTKDPSLMDTAHTETDHDAPTWADIRTDLRFELPGITLPLAAIAGLQPGAVMKIADTDAALRVEVFSGSRAIGRGELVAIGDGFGVRLLERLIALA